MGRQQEDSRQTAAISVCKLNSRNTSIAIVQDLLLQNSRLRMQTYAGFRQDEGRILQGR